MSNRTDLLWHRSCPGCLRLLRLTTSFWHLDSSRRDGFSSRCKRCRVRVHLSGWGKLLRADARGSGTNLTAKEVAEIVKESGK